MNKIDRMKELINILNNASMHYYRLSDSIMSDYEYDKLYDELVKLESETNTILSNSPTINVEYEVLDSLEKFTHPSSMLSLSKTKSVSDLESFLGDMEGILSWKLDGLTIVLTYENGTLLRGVTRGNGIVGEVITNNVKQFKNIPLSIPYKGHLVIRGEAIIKYSDFNKLNEGLDIESDLYKNPRNLCSGSVRQLDPKVAKSRNINCIIFALIECDMDFNSKSSSFEWLTKEGFEVVEYKKVNNKNISECVNNYKKRISNYDIPSDGLVLCYDDITYSKSLGTTAKYPKDAIAFKWMDESYETTLKEIDWMVSRTGLINPVAIFDPVNIDGTIVSRASIHNLSIMEKLKLGILDKIKVYKANMIIPQISENITKSNSIIIPSKCPICNHDTIIKSINDSKYLYCTNDHCVAKLLKKLTLFTSRNAMNIEGLSDATLYEFISIGFIKSFSDIYHLDRYKNNIIEYEGFGIKSYNNLINAIESSRKVKLANFIYSLGIPNIGFARAKLICNKCNNDYETLRSLDLESLSNIDGVGNIIALEWINKFNDIEFVNEVNDLLKEITFIDVKSNVNKVLNSKVFVITGSLEKYNNRDELISYIESLGGKVVTSISSKVSYLINNDINSTSTKNKDAKELNIPIINEDDFIKLIK